MIATKKFNLTKKEYFSIIVRVLIKQRWWWFAFMWLVTIFILLKDEKDSFDIFLIGFSILYPLIILLQYWRFTNSNENKSFFEERQYQISSDKIITYLGSADGRAGIDNFIKTLELKDVYLLYLSKTQSVYFPKRIFETVEDENWFRNEIFLKIKKK
ncbi:YcxB family protein [Flavobacterium hungaricum]|uniref:YcxB-like C-terminal domain-containing protein n=1 Tax=Flavobacterium hungaricum TaxID=2082725 RepID=A0ABR9TK44_9FLAO|nr:YcxB family protein [Flavobacterium hungaricum]MBE8725214.1 hypothetical protein [Flavobacterium hungaricum]